jgi:hypothetical protein
VASHRMPESERPRRPVPTWVTAPPEDDRRPSPDRATVAGTPPTVASVAASVVSGREARTAPATPALDPNAVVPDFPPQQELLPPAPTSPNVDTVPFVRVASAPAVPADGHPVALAAGAPGVVGGVADIVGPAAVGTAGAPSPLPVTDGSVGATAAAGAGRGVASAGPAQAVTGAGVAGAPVVAPGAVGGAPGAGTAQAVGGPTAPAPLRGVSRHGAPESHTVPAPVPTTVGPGHPADSHRGAHVLGAVPTGAPVADAVTPGGTAAAPTMPGGQPSLDGAPVAAPQQPPAPVLPVMPSTGQPRFSVPGLEHMVVEGAEPAPVGPIGYRTPARFAHQQAVHARPLPASVTTPPPVAGPPVLAGADVATTTPSFDAVIAPPTPVPSETPTASASTEARFPAAVVPTVQLPAVPLPDDGPDAVPSLAAVAAAVDLPTPLDATAPPTPASAHRNATGRGQSAWSRLRRRGTATPSGAAQADATVAAALPADAPLPPVRAEDGAPTGAAAPGLPAASDANPTPGDRRASRGRRSDEVEHPDGPARAGRSPKAARTPKAARPLRAGRTEHAHRAVPADVPGAPSAAAGAQPTAVAGSRSGSTRAVGATPAAVLGALAGLGTIGLAAWWFTAPGTVHAVGLLLGVLAVVLAVTTLRDAAASWQRPIALLGLVLGSVGTLVLLWAVLSAVLPDAGVTLPDITGTGTAVQIAP